MQMIMIPNPKVIDNGSHYHLNAYAAYICCMNMQLIMIIITIWRMVEPSTTGHGKSDRYPLSIPLTPVSIKDIGRAVYTSGAPHHEGYLSIP